MSGTASVASSTLRAGGSCLESLRLTLVWLLCLPGRGMAALGDAAVAVGSLIRAAVSAPFQVAASILSGIGMLIAGFPSSQSLAELERPASSVRSLEGPAMGAVERLLLLGDGCGSLGASVGAGSEEWSERRCAAAVLALPPAAATGGASVLDAAGSALRGSHLPRNLVPLATGNPSGAAPESQVGASSTGEMVGSNGAVGGGVGAHTLRPMGSTCPRRPQTHLSTRTPLPALLLQVHSILLLSTLAAPQPEQTPSKIAKAESTDFGQNSKTLSNYEFYGVLAVLMTPTSYALEKGAEGTLVGLLK